MNSSVKQQDLIGQLKSHAIWLFSVPTIIAIVTFYLNTKQLPQFGYMATLKMGQTTTFSGERFQNQNSAPLVSTHELRTFVMSTFSQESRKSGTGYLVGVNEYNAGGLNTVILALRAENLESAQSLVNEVVSQIEAKYGVRYQQFMKEKASYLAEAEEVYSANKKLQEVVRDMDSPRQKGQEEAKALALIGRALLSMEFRKTQAEIEGLKMSIDSKYSFPFDLMGVQQTATTPIWPKVLALSIGIWVVSFAFMCLFVLGMNGLRNRLYQ